MKLFFFSSHRVKGQGLVEYAIIIALVAVVVIAIMIQMGPKVGNTFSTINLSLGADGVLDSEEPTAVPSRDFVHVANEGGTINIPAGEYEVRYGANGVYFTRHITGPVTLTCNSATFGDPIPGVTKSCSMRVSP